MLRKLTLAAAAAALFCGFAGDAFAGSATANLSVSASVSTNCTIAATAVAFGAYDPIGANAATDRTGAGSIVVTCTKNSSGISVGLGLGSYASGSTRRMASGSTASEYLSYEIYHPTAATPSAACTGSQVWGTAGAGVFTPSTTWGASTPRTFNVCGIIPAGQNVSGSTSGESYSDTVVATVNF